MIHNDPQPHQSLFYFTVGKVKQAHMPAHLVTQWEVAGDSTSAQATLFPSCYQAHMWVGSRSPLLHYENGSFSKPLFT